MTKTLKALCVLVGIFCVLNTFFPFAESGGKVAAENREVKAVWAATVFSLDYPKKQTSSAESLKADMDALVADVCALGCNTLFFQVRPASDAFYRSEIFPWSQYLTGTQGASPDDGFDPLEYLVAQAHARGVEVHAWINPYRVTASAADKARQSEGSIAVKYPHLVVEHTDGKLYLNPGVPETNELVIAGAEELVRNYRIDGIHLDDYFYPGSAFPDAETFAKYGGEYADIGDWRRANTRALVEGLRDAVGAVRSDIVFSVSPSGIWANAETNPEGSDTNGAQAYYDYYADTRGWVKDGLVDMIVPQIYWSIGNEGADFEELLKWWSETVKETGVALCIGRAAYRAADDENTASPWYGENGLFELRRQSALINADKTICGSAYYRLGSITKNSALAQTITDLNTGEKRIFADTAEFRWAEDAIESLYDKGIVSGMGDGTFGCARNVTRADFTLMITRAMGKTAEFSENFDDVTQDKYYYREIGIAKALGYASGRGENLFDPTGAITRQDMATMAYRVLRAEGKIGTDGTSLGARFSDAYEIAEYAEEAVSAMVEKGYLSGYENGEFKPEGLATRAETAVFLNRIVSK